MAKFCTKCGKPLTEGKACECQQQTEKIGTQSNSKLTYLEIIKEYFEIVKKIIKKPIDTLKDNSSESKFHIALLSIAVTSIAMGLFLCILVKSLMSFVPIMIAAPYIQIFLGGLISMIILILVLASITYVVSDKIFKGQTTIKKMIILYGLSSVVLASVLIIASFLLLLSLSVQIIYGIIILGLILWIAYSVKGIEYYSKININNIGYAVSLSYGVTSILVYHILETLLPNLFM